MERISLLEEYRLIERAEYEINAAWKGAHILLFFLAFIFGCFCTFCFHMLMYMFDEKCVLFPKLQSLTSLRHNVIYEFVPSGTDAADMPVDFLSTQWMEKSACYLPTFVPLVSGIFGLVWTTMFLMSSTGSRTLSGLQRPWRILPPIFLFSLAMGGVCVYSSSLTHNGLEELCLKLSEITGSPTCSYTVNVATLVYERRIRGVYQATRLTIMSAWLHTGCWILSAMLVLLRVILVVDFQLVRVNVDLIGDIDKMLEKEEAHVRTVSPDRWLYTSEISLSSQASTSNKVQFKRGPENKERKTDMLYMLYLDEKQSQHYLTSDLSLVPEERSKLQRKRMCVSIKKKHYFIAKMVIDLIDNLNLPTEDDSGLESPPSFVMEVIRQYGQSRIKSVSDQETLHRSKKKEISRRWQSETNIDPKKSSSSTSIINATESMRTIKRESSRKKGLDSGSLEGTSGMREKTSKKEKYRRKSNLKHVSIQTEKHKKKESRDNLQKVKISAPKTDSDTSSGNTKTSKKQKKEKQD